MKLDEEKEWIQVTGHKDIMIFNITEMNTDMDANTNRLIQKMNQCAKDHQLDVTIHMDSASKTDTRGKDADIILLGPELFAMCDEVKQKYPDKVVKVIDQKDFGFWDGEKVLKAALS